MSQRDISCSLCMNVSTYNLISNTYSSEKVTTFEISYVCACVGCVLQSRDSAPTFTHVSKRISTIERDRR